MPVITTPHGIAICYETFGDPGDPVLLLIQGLGAQMLGWREEFCAAIAAEGFRVVRFDNRDVGLSGKVEAPYSLGDLAEDTAGLLQALEVSAAHVVGQSMGGMIAQHLAARYPETVLSLGLIYTSPNVGFVTGAELVAARPELPANLTRAQAVTRYVQDEKDCASTGYEQDVGWLAELGGQMYDRSHDLDGVQRQIGAVLGEADRSEIVKDITAATTIIHGSADRMIAPAASEALHGLIDDSTLTIFDGMGHELPEPLWPDIIGLLMTNAAQGARQAA